VSKDILVCIPAVEGPVAKACEVTGVSVVASDGRVTDLAQREPTYGFIGAIVDASTTSVTDAMSTCRQLRSRENPISPVILIIQHHQLDELTFRDDLFDDFIVAPVDVLELSSRLHHRLRRAGHSGGSSLIDLGGLVINLETYQASINGRSLDFTFMEYELLRFLAANPHRVFTRETLLNRVWGYEYYGGARTVDVHVRRLRAKLGEENAHLITTIRSVGYKFNASNTRSDAN
jgi:DNA-binding response OmpR family regulator